MSLFKKTINENNNTPKNDERFYESLAPKSEIENGEEYMAALEWALKQDDIHNIAVSGPYGSGKSSVINSFLKKRKQIKTLRISLATLGQNSSEHEDYDKNIFGNDLEEEILKQIFYSVSTTDIPKSRYRRIVRNKWYSNLFLSLSMPIILCGMFYLFKHELIDSIIDSLPVFALIISLLLLYAALVVVFCCFFGWLKDHGRVKEIELISKTSVTMEADDSIFNKNMDEIVYFFENTKTELVIIEDLDRFKNTNIFVALRNLNVILNNNKNITGKITFIYAIRDDLFITPGERTKFFDFIIPIIPIVSSTNSGEVLRKLLKIDKTTDSSTLYDIKGSMITLISPYISDMRDVISICNEFNIIWKTLKVKQELHLKDENMFALVVFKNLYPKDFAELEDEKDESIIRIAFEKKRQFITSKVHLIEVHRQEAEQRLKRLENETMRSVRELKAALLMSLHNPPLPVISIKVDGKSFDLATILDDSFNINTLKSPLEVFCGAGIRPPSFPVSKPEELISDNGDYFTRIEHLTKGLDKSKEDTKRDIEAFEKKTNEISKQPIKNIISEYGTNFLGESVSANMLLVFLLRNGYLDETYDRYINYFHPNSITKEEMNYILGIRNHNSDLEYSFPLKNVSQVFERLMDYEFVQKETLNFDMVDYVLTRKHNSPQEKALMNQLSDHDEQSIGFIKAYVDRSEHLDVFIHLLCKYNSRFWTEISSDSAVSIDRAFLYLNLMFEHAEINDILKQDRDSDDVERPLSSFLLKHSDSLKRLANVSAEKQVMVIDSLKIEFRKIELDTVADQICDCIFTNNHYMINVYMIHQLFAWKNPDLLNLFETQNYSAIMDLGFTPLIKKIASDFPQYIEEVFLNISPNENESYERTNQIINQLLPDNYNLCIRVLDKEKACWENITDCCEDPSIPYGETKQNVWKYLLINDRIACKVENVQSYFDEFGFDDDLEQYFDKHASTLLEHINDPGVSDELKNSIFISDISDESFKQFVRVVHCEIPISDFRDIGKSKTEILISEGWLPFSVSDWIRIKDLWPNLNVIYTQKYFKEFMDSISEIPIDENDLQLYLNDHTITDDDKSKILNQFDCAQMTASIAELICELDYVIDKSHSDAAWPYLTDENKVLLLLHQMSNYSNKEISKLLEDIGGEYIKLTPLKKHQYVIPYNEINKELMDKLLARNYVTSVKVDSKKGVKKSIYGYVKEIP